MTWLILATVCQSFFALSLKGAGRSGVRLPPVGVTNYFTGAIVFGLLWILGPNPQPASREAVLFGTLTGVNFVLNFHLLQRTLAEAGVAVAQAVMRMAVVMPVAAGILLFDESPTTAQWIGMALAAPALPLLSMGGSPASSAARGGSAILVLLLLFVNTGIGMVAIKGFSMSPNSDDHRAAFGLLLFGSAAIAGPFFMGVPRGPAAGRELGWGAAVGLFNVGGVHFLTAALVVLPGVVAFPINTIGAIALTSLAAVVFFDERPGIAGAIGLALATAAAVLLNWK